MQVGLRTNKYGKLKPSKQTSVYGADHKRHFGENFKIAFFCQLLLNVPTTFQRRGNKFTPKCLYMISSLWKIYPRKSTLAYSAWTSLTNLNWFYITDTSWTENASFIAKVTTTVVWRKLCLPVEKKKEKSWQFANFNRNILAPKIQTKRIDSLTSNDESWFKASWKNCRNYTAALV